ncbi:hypothetical protein ACMFMG_010488 [Clarireedia jacksonii]
MIWIKEKRIPWVTTTKVHLSFVDILCCATRSSESRQRCIASYHESISGWQPMYFRMPRYFLLLPIQAFEYHLVQVNTTDVDHQKCRAISQPGAEASSALALDAFNEFTLSPYG